MRKAERSTGWISAPAVGPRVLKHTQTYTAFCYFSMLSAPLWLLTVVQTVSLKLLQLAWCYTLGFNITATIYKQILLLKANLSQLFRRKAAHIWSCGSWLWCQKIQTKFRMEIKLIKQNQWDTAILLNRIKKLAKANTCWDDITHPVTPLHPFSWRQVGLTKTSWFSIGLIWRWVGLSEANYLTLSV